MLDILVVDDDDIIRESVSSALAGAGHRVTSAPDGQRALDILGRSRFDVAVCDVQMPGIDGISLFRRLRRDAPGTDVVLMTAFGSVADAVATVRDGAEYVTKPFDPDDLARDVIAPIERRRAAGKAREEAWARAASRRSQSGLIGSSVVMRRLAERIASVAQTDADVLVVGEAGTGKALIARSLHAQSGRGEGPIVNVSCAALVSGPRSDAFQVAEGGTLILSGVEALSPGAQSAFLRVLGGRHGHARTGPSLAPRGVRLVTLSRDDLASRVAAGYFLEPLYFRLADVELKAPPLRERAGDLYVLVSHFLRRLAPPGGLPLDLSPAAWRVLHDYPFPGNVGELSRALEHAASVTQGGTIGVEHLPETIRVATARRS